MSKLIWVTKEIGVPGSVGFFGLCTVIAVIIGFIGPRSRRLAALWMLVVIAAYIVAALPPVSRALAAGLPTYAPLWTPGTSDPEDILVVLSGDNALGRARETRRVLDAITPRCVLVSGSGWFVRMLVEAGVERNRLIVDDTTKTTREQITKLPEWARQCGARRVIVIASTLSMPRVAALASRSPVPVLLAPAPLDASPPASGIYAALPSASALGVTRDALYEHAALAYYRRQGWIR